MHNIEKNIGKTIFFHKLLCKHNFNQKKALWKIYLKNLCTQELV